ncbi:MAG: DoxX family protein [Chitinophagaceae bacterium]|jgi:putative oxidoreductase|nr:DoxX family protein [Chitinophagaceae bacterium]
MKKLLSTQYPGWAFNISMFLLRAGLGLLMIPHGYDKLVHFATYKKDFLNFLGMGGTISLALTVFAEFFCSIFLIMGLFSRLTVIPLIINMVVVIFQAHNGDIFGDGEHGSLFLIGYLAILLCGPGKASVDGIMGK